LYDAAVSNIQTMVDLRPDLGSYSRVSYARELHGDLDGAIEAMQRAVRAGGPTTENTEWARVQLGHLHAARGDLTNAENVYRMSLDRLPGYPPALAGLARIQAARGKYETAIESYRQAIARLPLAEFVIALGETYEAAGRMDDAMNQYELVRAMQRLNQANGINVDPELALFEADHGNDPQSTLALARRAYRQRPGIKGAEALAWALFRAGKYAEARETIDQALRLGTQDALLFYRASAIAQAQGDLVAARHWLGQALALNPHFSLLYAPQARIALAEIGVAGIGGQNP
jgi:tetratricopeptide (TPR) repeat protein